MVANVNHLLAFVNQAARPAGGSGRSARPPAGAALDARVDSLMREGALWTEDQAVEQALQI